MSYSFTIFASSKEKAKAIVEAKLDEVAEQQPVHRVDRDQAVAAASAFIELCDEPGDAQELSVTVHGSVNWNGNQTSPQVMGAGVGVTVATVHRQSTAAPAA